MSLKQLILDERKTWLNARVEDMTVDGDMTIEGNVTFAGDVDIQGQLTVQGVVDLQNDVGVQGDFDVNQNTNIAGNLDVGGHPVAGLEVVAVTATITEGASTVASGVQCYFHVRECRDGTNDSEVTFFMNAFSGTLPTAADEELHITFSGPVPRPTADALTTIRLVQSGVLYHITFLIATTTGHFTIANSDRVAFPNAAYTCDESSISYRSDTVA